jgi:DNA polymerase III subunit epsilon
MRQIVLDTETTGLSPKEGHRIIEIGCLEMVNRRLTGNNLHLYINPERHIEKGAAQVHGITESFLQDKPVFKDIVKELMDFLKAAELIIHNAPFDVGFLNHELKLIKKSHHPITHYCGVVDSLVIARRKHPGQQNSLDALCRRYHVDNSNRELHGALLDAELLAQVYLLMTGGQSQLFDTEASEGASTAVTKKIHQAVENPESLPIIKATKVEQQAHENFLNKMKEVN